MLISNVALILCSIEFSTHQAPLIHCHSCGFYVDESFYSGWIVLTNNIFQKHYLDMWEICFLCTFEIISYWNVNTNLTEYAILESNVFLPKLHRHCSTILLHLKVLRTIPKSVFALVFILSFVGNLFFIA